MLIWTVIAALALCLPTADAYAMYAERIPNGDHVPHPCKPNFIWHGVGHQNSQGGGARNPFGEDFAGNGHKWTEALCRKDSDGDGRTNGQELGDPNCVWTQGQTPPITTDITHPGVCDPWNAVQCVAKNAWLDCSRDEEFTCPHINDPEVINITLRFPRTKVPAKETTYICFNFQLPDDREYHLIASKPAIDNRNVMHHIVMSACNDKVQLLDKPEECLMGAEGCSEGLGGWTLGYLGNCMNPKAGFLVGKGHTSILSMQLHWTNPGLVDEWYDSSGMVLYLTPKLREYNAAIMSLGQMYLNIPPGQSSWVHSGTCSSRCSRLTMKGDLQVLTSFNHMHYLGVRQNVTLTRSGERMTVINDDNPYSYDNPQTHEYDPPLIIHPGDELTTHCTYQSRSRAKTTTYGEGSFDEMCFAFLYYFPAENLESSFCGQWKDMDICDLGEKCDFRIFNSSDPSTAAIVKTVLDNCDPSSTCRVECQTAIEEVSAQSGCIRNTWDYVAHMIMQSAYDAKLMKFVAAMNSCTSTKGGESTGKPGWVTPRPATEKPTDPTMPSHEGPGSMLMNLVKSIGSKPLLQNIIMNVNYNNNYRAGANKGEHDDTWH